jgi:hypothetical protein
MTRQGLATNLGGSLQLWSFQFTYNDVTDTADTKKTMDLFDILTGPPYNTSTAWKIPQGSVVLYIRVKASTAWAATPASITSVKIRVGKSGAATNFFTGDYELTTTVADGTLQETFNLPLGQLSAATPTVTITAVGANLSTMSAGVVNIDMLLVPVTTPTTTPYSSTNVL